MVKSSAAPWVDARGLPGGAVVVRHAHLHPGDLPRSGVALGAAGAHGELEVAPRPRFILPRCVRCGGCCWRSVRRPRAGGPRYAPTGRSRRPRSGLVDDLVYAKVRQRNGENRQPLTRLGFGRGRSPGTWSASNEGSRRLLPSFNCRGRAETMAIDPHLWTPLRWTPLLWLAATSWKPTSSARGSADVDDELGRPSQRVRHVADSFGFGYECLRAPHAGLPELIDTAMRCEPGPS